MADPAELDQNLAAANDTSPLSPAELEKIEAMRKELGTQFCRRCGYCAPCTVGINIPGVFVFEGYLRRYGLAGWAKDRYAALPVKFGNKQFGKIEPELRKTDGFMAFDVAMYCKDDIEQVLGDKSI